MQIEDYRVPGETAETPGRDILLEDTPNPEEIGWGTKYSSNPDRT
jgi:hypothetical protein